MKILMLCEFYDPALQFQENQLVKYLRKQGHEVMVLTSLFDRVFDYYSGKIYPQGVPRLIKDHGALIWKLPYKYNLLNKIRPYKGVVGKLDGFAPDLIYIHDIIPNTPEIARYCKKHPQVRSVMDIHMDYSNSGKNLISLKILHGVIRKYFLDRIRPYLSNIYAVNPPAIEFMSSVYSIPEQDMELLPLAPDNDLIEEVKSSFNREDFRRGLGIQPDEVVVITGGKITPRKKLELLLEAMDSERLVNSRVIVIGDFQADDDRYKKIILERAERLGNRVIFVGWQDAAGCYRHMLAADIAVFPASQSVMWQQSIGCGLPLIVGDTGQQDPHYLNRHNNMCIVEAHNINAQTYRELMSNLVENPQMRLDMAKGAQQTADEFLDWNIVIRKITGA